MNPNVRILACQPANSAVMYESIKRGEIVELVSKPTLSDGSAGGIETGSITFDIVKRVVDDFIIVSEEEIKESLKEIYDKTKIKVEGAAAVALASFRKVETQVSGDSVIVICGGNIDSELFESIISK
jgi:threonine dehydratase